MFEKGSAPDAADSRRSAEFESCDRDQRGGASSDAARAVSGLGRSGSVLACARYRCRASEKGVAGAAESGFGSDRRDCAGGVFLSGKLSCFFRLLKDDRGSRAVETGSDCPEKLGFGGIDFSVGCDDAEGGFQELFFNWKCGFIELIESGIDLLQGSCL